MLDATSLAVKAMRLMEQPWHEISLSNHPDLCEPLKDDVIVDRLTALLFIRIVGVLKVSSNDYSTLAICKKLLQPKASSTDNTLFNTWIPQLHEFVKTIIQGYASSNDIFYHNRRHAYHVTVSTNKLVDLLVTSNNNTFGLRNNPIALLSLVFSALVHDVQHTGVPNKQLAKEGTEWAVRFNDQSIAENTSLYVAFCELLDENKYEKLQQVMFGQVGSSAYEQFRQYVITLVLTTDLASTERRHVNKSKWTDAFEKADLYEKKSTNNDSNNTSNNNNATDTKRAIAIEIINKKQKHQDQDYNDEDFYEATSTYNSASTTKSANSATNKSLKSLHNHSQATTATEDSSSLDSDNNNNQRLPDYCYDDNDTHMHSTDFISCISVTTNSNNNKVLRFKEQTAILSLPPDVATTTKSSSDLPDGLHPNEFRRRLNIGRNVQVTREILQVYSQQAINDDDSNDNMAVDTPDELKAGIVMDCIITAADVAHNLQSWQHMVKWSTCLYHELMQAYEQGRGFDPSRLWFENQLSFLELYLMPVARKLEKTGVYDSNFGKLVQENRDRWIREGWQVTKEMIAERKIALQ